MARNFDSNVAGGNIFREDDLLAVLLALQDKTNRELHVATLGIATAVNEADNTVTVMSFPKAEGKDEAVLTALCIKHSQFEEIKNNLNNKPIVLAIMTDRFSLANFKNIKSTKRVNAVNDNNALHSYTNAVIAFVGDTVYESEEK